MILPAIFHRLWTAPALATSEPCAARWLGPGEHEILANLRDPPRRAAFLAGRILAKRIILEDLITGEDRYESLTAPEIEIISRDGFGRSVQPRVFLLGRQQSWSVSIAHSRTAVLAAIVQQDDISVGVDLTPHDFGRRAFTEMWLTPRERQFWQASGPRDSLATIWALKEAAYKAIGQGEPFIPTHIEVFSENGHLTCSWKNAAQHARPRVEILAAGANIAAIVAISKVSGKSAND